MSKIRTYSGLKRLSSFNDRYEYLRLGGFVGESTFGFNRMINQTFYRSDQWRKTRRGIIIRDEGRDMGVEGYDIGGRVIVHHIVPITEDDILEMRDICFDPDNLICVSHNTHEAIHFSDASLLPQPFAIRRPGDTCPWR